MLPKDMRKDTESEKIRSFPKRKMYANRMDEELLRQLKVYAKANNTSVQSVIEDAVYEYFNGKRPVLCVR